MKYSNYSVLIIGGGAAGLFLAHKLSFSNNLKDGILLVTKGKLGESNTKYAQGGIVGVMPDNKEDSSELHIKETISSGCGLNDFASVSFISEHSCSAIEDLIRAGVHFDRDENNNLIYTLEGAHSVPRILHAAGDATGRVIEESLVEAVLRAKNIEIYENAMAVDLLQDRARDCKGAVIYRADIDDYEAIYAGATVLATGGVGQVYKYTTNPYLATGDGLVLAKSAGCEIKDMEFIQFHPTALNVKDDEKMPLVSESVRGEGAVIVNSQGEEFVSRYDKRGSLAPRDVVSGILHKYLKENSEDSIYLDISRIGLDNFEKRFPTITSYCAEHQINLENLLIPVTPSAHYCMGGIKANVAGETDVNNLYAVGEVACTGLHGANRLASNSLLECVVCASELARKIDKKEFLPIKKIDDEIKKTLSIYDEARELHEFNCDELRRRIKNLMWRYVGIEREEKGLLQALFELKEIGRILGSDKKCLNREQYELRNLLQVAEIIARSAFARKKSVGAHKRIDYIESEPFIVGEYREDELFVK